MSAERHYQQLDIQILQAVNADLEAENARLQARVKEAQKECASAPPTQRIRRIEAALAATID